MAEVCDKCGKEISVGDWPWCKGAQSDHTPIKSFSYDAWEPYFDEHITARGAQLDTRGDRQRLMRENHLERPRQRDKRGKTLYFI